MKIIKKILGKGKDQVVSVFWGKAEKSGFTER